MLVFLLLMTVSGCLSRPTWEEGEPTPPPGPPEILSEGEVGEQWEQEDWEAEEELARLENQLASQLPGLEITAVVSRAPFEEWEEEGGNRTWEDLGERNIGEPVVDSTSLLLLSWWQVRRFISIPIHIQLLPALCI